MPIQPTRPEAEEDGTLDAYAHLYDVKAEERDRIAADEAEKAARKAGDERLDDAIKKEVEDRKAADEEIKGMIGSSDINVISPIKVIGSASSGYATSLAIGNYSSTATGKVGCVAVGNYSSCSDDRCIAVGDNSLCLKYQSAAIGNDARALHSNSVALGFGTVTSRDNELSIGDASRAAAAVRTRLIANVTDPELPQDAATKNYVDTNTVNASSDSITVADGKAKLNPSIFSDGITATDAQVSADVAFIGEHLAGDGLYYDATDGLQVKAGDGLEVQNDQLCIDQDKLPLASASNRGTVKVGSAFDISSDGTLDVSQDFAMNLAAQAASLASSSIQALSKYVWPVSCISVEASGVSVDYVVAYGYTYGSILFMTSLNVLLQCTTTSTVNEQLTLHLIPEAINLGTSIKKVVPLISESTIVDGQAWGGTTHNDSSPCHFYMGQSGVADVTVEFTSSAKTYTFYNTYSPYTVVFR